MSRWYRAYEGTVSDPKLAEVAMVAGVSRSVAIATWHAILESAAGNEAEGAFDTTPRRIAVTLVEKVADIEAVFSALTECNCIRDGVVVAWKQRQFTSDRSTERVKQFRERRRNADETFHPVSETAGNGSETDAAFHGVSGREIGGCGGGESTPDRAASPPAGRQKRASQPEASHAKPLTKNTQKHETGRNVSATARPVSATDQNRTEQIYSEASPLTPGASETGPALDGELFPPDRPPGPGSGQASSLKDQLFGPALAALAARAGKPAGACRSFIGKLVRDVGEAQALDLIMAAERESAIDPMAWITAAKQVRSTNGQRRPGRQAVRSEREIDAELAAWAASKTEHSR